LSALQPPPEFAREVMAVFARLAKTGLLTLDGDRYELTAAGRARVCRIVGIADGPVHRDELPRIAARVEEWRGRHPENSDDSVLMTAAQLVLVGKIKGN
jgi:hypothetical protein